MQIIYNYFYKLRAFSVWGFLILLVLGFNSVQAQQSGNIRGVIIEAGSGEPLFGANAIIMGTSKGAAADLEGKFIIRAVEAGEHQLRVSFLGYQTTEEIVTVTAGETIEVEFELRPAGVVGDEVTITSQRRGQVAAINEQLSSNTITNVVSAERIQEIPDINAAESVGRLSGISVVRSGGEGQKVTIRGMSPQYNVIMVNGVRMQSTDRENRSVDLNMIAPNVLSGISVTKALTADMDADAVGGTVNLRIGKAREGFHSNFSLQGGSASMAYTNAQRYGNYRLSGLITNRFLENKLGVQVSGFMDNQNRNSDVLSSGYFRNEDDVVDEDGFIPIYLGSVTINDRVTDRQRAGGSIVLDYELPNGSLILNNFISNLHEDQITQNNTYTTGYDWRGWATVGEFNNTVINNALQGEFEFGSIQMDFSVSNSVSKQRNPNNLRMDIRTESGGTRGLEELEGCSNLNRMSPTRFMNCVEVIPRGKIATGTSSLIRDVDVTAQAAALNFNIPFNFTDYLTGNVKLGGKVERNTRDNDETSLFVNTDRGGLTGRFIDLLRDEWPELGLRPEDSHISHVLVRDSDYVLEDFLSGNEGINANRFYNLISLDHMHRMEQIARENGLYLPDPLGSSQYDYNYTRNFQAFYVMSEINISKYVTLQPGIRYEAFGFDYTADSTVVFNRLFDLNDPYYRSKTVNWDYTRGENWFPQMQVRIKPTNWFDIRLARTKSIIYPDYRAISPYLFKDEFPSTHTLRLGNPFLKPSTTVNYDIYASVYENHIGLLTAGVFYKEIEDFIVPVSYLTNDASKINNRVNLASNQLTSINTWINLDKTSHVKGIELEWQTQFWYLPWIFEGLVFNINYTHMQSESHYTHSFERRIGTPPIVRTVRVDTTRSDRLLDQPDDILNFTVGYDIGGFSARMSYQYTDNIIRNVATTYRELNSFTSAYKRWDFSARQELPWLEGLQIYMNVNNITNRPDRSFNGRGNLTNVQYYGRTAALGVRYSF